MSKRFLYEELDTLREHGGDIELPNIIKSGLARKIELREYQIDAFKNFLLYFQNNSLRKNKQLHTLFHMATGSGKTVIMAGLILYLYEKGYRKFLFFVNQTNVLEKTIENFTNPLSSKYLFNEVIEFLGDEIKIKKVDNFSSGGLAGNDLNTDIEIVFSTTQKLHMDLCKSSENSLTCKDFENNEIVFISDESHHVNTLTKSNSKDERELNSSWESSITKALFSNRNSIMLEFTATCDLKDRNVLDKYLDKIVFNYPLLSFRKSGYTKDFQNVVSNTNLWTRALISLVLSEYRRFLFADLKLNVKPVVMLKSQKIVESVNFYDEFFKKINTLSVSELEGLKDTEVNILDDAIEYFKAKDLSLELLERSIKSSFTVDNSIMINGASDNNKENQLLVNSLEDLENPIRLIFAVDMLNEGWDVLNLFDIVRLYDTRQTGKAGKISNYTIKEAQLIGRGARYCPFVIDDEDIKFKRKYDIDLLNKNRVLETMFFHSKNDSKYISELKFALIATGLQDDLPNEVVYSLKEEFKDSDFYNKSFVYSNKRLLKNRKDVNSIEPSVRNKTYYYTSHSGKGSIINLFEQKHEKLSQAKSNIKSIKLKDIELNILTGAIECFHELRFNVLKEKYPNLKSTREFLTSNDFLGNSVIEITYFTDEITGRDMFLAVKNALSQIASHVMSLKQEYVGSKEFTPKMLKNVLRDKVVKFGNIDENGGKGASQNSCNNDNYKLDLSRENWYVFNDNFGTNEEKLFIKYFKVSIEPKLKDKGLEYYVVRNERIPDLAIYSFEAGKRFEPDFLLFVRKKGVEDCSTYQGYVEPKGSHLLECDKWKEDFLTSMESTAYIGGKFKGFGNYKIIGMPFFNNANRRKEFEDDVNNWIDSI